MRVRCRDSEGAAGGRDGEGLGIGNGSVRKQGACQLDVKIGVGTGHIDIDCTSWGASVLNVGFWIQDHGWTDPPIWYEPGFLTRGRVMTLSAVEI